MKIKNIFEYGNQTLANTNAEGDSFQSGWIIEITPQSVHFIELGDYQEVPISNSLIADSLGQISDSLANAWFVGEGINVRFDSAGVVSLNFFDDKFTNIKTQANTDVEDIIGAVNSFIDLFLKEDDATASHINDCNDLRRI